MRHLRSKQGRKEGIQGGKKEERREGERKKRRKGSRNKNVGTKHTLRHGVHDLWQGGQGMQILSEIKTSNKTVTRTELVLNFHLLIYFQRNLLYRYNERVSSPC